MSLTYQRVLAGIDALGGFERTEAKETYKQARERLLAHLKSQGWKVNEHLKIPRADSGDTTLWFKSQAIYMATGPGRDFQSARSIHIGDLRGMSTKEFVEYLIKWGWKPPAGYHAESLAETGPLRGPWRGKSRPKELPKDSPQHDVDSIPHDPTPDPKEKKKQDAFDKHTMKTYGGEPEGKGGDEEEPEEPEAKAKEPEGEEPEAKKKPPFPPIATRERVQKGRLRRDDDDGVQPRSKLEVARHVGLTLTIASADC
jgi:hypothetical protein